MRSHGAGITGSCQCSSVHFHSNSTPMWISEPVILQLDRQQSRDFDETCKDFQRCRHDNNARDAKRSNVILGLMMGLVTSLRGGAQASFGPRRRGGGVATSSFVVVSATRLCSGRHFSRALLACCWFSVFWRLLGSWRGVIQSNCQRRIGHWRQTVRKQVITSTCIKRDNKKIK